MINEHTLQFFSTDIPSNLVSSSETVDELFKKVCIRYSFKEWSDIEVSEKNDIIRGSLFQNLIDNPNIFINTHRLFNITDEYVDIVEKSISSYVYPIYTDFKINTLLKEQSMSILKLQKAGIKYMIESLSKQMEHYYSELYQTYEKNNKDYTDPINTHNHVKLIQHFHLRNNQWSRKEVVDTSVIPDSITKSSLVEYIIFQLVNIYKNFDFSNRSIIVYKTELSHFF